MYCTNDILEICRIPRHSMAIGFQSQRYWHQGLGLGGRRRTVPQTNRHLNIRPLNSPPTGSCTIGTGGVVEYIFRWNEENPLRSTSERRANWPFPKEIWNVCRTFHNSCTKPAYSRPPLPSSITTKRFQPPPMYSATANLPNLFAYCWAIKALEPLPEDFKISSRPLLEVRLPW